MSSAAASGEAPARTKTLGHGAVWSFTSTLVTRVTGIAITAIVVHIVSPHDFGVFTIAATVYAIVSSFSELGLSACIVRRDVELPAVAPSVALLSLASGLATAGMMVAFAPAIGALLGSADAAGPIRVLAIVIVISSFTTVSNAALARDFRQGNLFVGSLVAFVPMNASLVVLALHGDGALAFAWSRVIGQAVLSAWVVVAAGRYWWPAWNVGAARIAVGFGAPLAGANLLNYLFLNADYAFVGRLLGPAVLASYTLAFTAASWSTAALAGTVNSVALPAFSADRGAPQLLAAALGRWCRMLALLAFPVCAILAVLARPLIITLYGERWTEAIPVLAVLCTYSAVFIVTLLFSNLLVALGRTGRVLIIQASWLAALIVAIFVGVELFGLIGAAVAHVVVICAVVVPLYCWALRGAGSGLLSAAGRAVIAPLIAASVSAAAALAVSALLEPEPLKLIAGLAAGGVVYALLALPVARDYLPQSLRRRMPRYLDLVATLTAARLLRSDAR